MKSNKIIYWISTGLLTALMMFSTGMYFFNYAEINSAFMKLGFPTYIIYPLAIAKLVGLIVIWTKKSKALTEWAYAGFFFTVVLALSAHITANDGEFAPALLGLVFVLVSYISYKNFIVKELRMESQEK